MDLELTNPLRLLIVDDDEVDRMTIKRSLRKANIMATITTADTANAGFQFVQEQEFDCIFIDFVLPDNNGLDLLNQIRQKGINTPILIVTSQGDERIAVEAIRSGASDYISKNLLTPEGISYSVRNAIRVYQVQKQREAAELALRKSEARLKEAQRLAKIGSWEFNLETLEIRWSEQMFELTGLDYLLPPPTYEQFMNLVHPDDLERCEAYLEEAFARKLPYNLDFRIITSTDKLKYVHANGTPIPDSSGKVNTFIGTLQDITERITTQTALKESEERYRNLIETMNEGVVYVDTNEVIQFVNKRYCEMLGYQREELIGKSTLLLLADEKAVQTINHKGKLRKKNISDQYELSLKRKNGEIIWVLVGGSPIFNGKGELIGSMGTHTDITERKKIEEALASSEKRFRTLFENAQSFICTHTLSGKITSMNKAGIDIFGNNPEEVIGKNLEEFFDKNKKLLFGQYLKDLEKNNTSNGVFTIRNKKNGYKHYLMYQSILYEESGSEPYVISTAQDITDRVTAEKELINAKEVAEHSVKIKEQFLANMSHEIRTPMNGIIGLTNILDKMITDPEKKSYLQAIQASADRLLIIINDILDFSKIESGKVEIEHVDFNFKNLLREIIELFELRAVERNNKLKYILDAELPEIVNGDPGKLAQILNNLISNAVKFTEKGQIKLLVEVLSENDNELVLEFAVQDTGIGIPEEKLIKVFESFTQASSDTTRKYGGTGLGLTICKKLIELQGGTISVESQVNKGSTFRFTLPFLKATASGNKATDFIQINPSELGNLRILVAEDNEINQLLMRKIIQTWGFTSEMAENGLVAVEKFTDNSFDLILMDVQMPEMDGYEAMSYIRKLKKPKCQVPIIALTAHATKEEENKCLQAGADAYISKPFKNEVLLQKISELILHKEATYTSEPETQDPSFSSLSNEDIVNLEYLYELSGGEVEFMTEIINLFRLQAPEYINNLHSFTNQKDWENLKKSAHKMKSSAGLLGINSLRELLETLEKNSSPEAELNRINELVSQVEAIYHKAIEELSVVLQNLEDNPKDGSN